MSDKDLSKPVAYSLRFRRLDDNELESRINTNTVFSSYDEASKYGLGGDYKMQSDGSIKWVKNPAKNPKVEQLYSHKYVQSLLGRIAELENTHSAPTPHHNGMMQLSNELAKANARIAELEAIVNTQVKLPPLVPDNPVSPPSPSAIAHNNAITACAVAIRGAGFKSEATAWDDLTVQED